jgi:hypothetical protein
MQVTQSPKNAEYWLNFRDECAAYIEKHLQKKIVSIEPIAIVPKKEEVIFTPPKKEVYTAINNDNAEFIVKERASILSVDQNLPYDWAEAITKTRAIVGSPHFNFLSLQELKLSLEYWCSDEFKIIRSFIEADWSLIDIFGCNGSSPCKVDAQKGLLLLFEGSFRINKVSSYSIEYIGRLGAKCTYYGVKTNRAGMKLVSEL